MQGLKLYKVTYKIDGIEHSDVAFSTEALLGACASDYEARGCTDIDFVPVFLEGVHVEFNELTNALKYCGWNGMFTQFADFQEHVPEIIRSHETSGFDIGADDFRVESARLLSTFTTQFVMGNEKDIVVLCPSCTFWSDYNWEVGANHIYTNTCPECWHQERKRRELVVVEKAQFVSANEAIGKWDEVSAWRRELPRPSRVRNREIEASAL